jgi:hypothetical protein
MKNFTKVKASLVKHASLITLAVVAIFLAVSCAPPLEETGYDWKDANATRDATKNSGYNASDYAPTATIKTTYGTGAAENTIIEIDVNITFPDRADVLRSEITQAALGFITFHTFTKATASLTADELSAAIPFTLENRTGNVVSVKLTTSINTAAAYSSLLLRVDGKKYTYDHGLRLDIDANGKIENIYDDQFIRTLTINGKGSGTEAYYYVGPAYYAKVDVNFSNLPYVSTETTAPANPAVNEFFFTGTGQSTNSNTLRVASIGTITSTSSAEWKAFCADVGSTLAKGIKLQKLNGTTWADAGSAEYDDAAPTPSSTSWSSYIVIKGVTFDHLATYRIIWTGSANTETTGTYYGVKVRLYIDDGDARPMNRTQVVGGTITPVNSKLASFISGNFFASNATITANSYDSEDRNVVLKVDLTNSGLYWKTVALADFKKSFYVVYSLGGGSVSNGASDLVYVDVKDVKFEAEGSAIVGGTEKGKNVLYITLDPNFVFDVTAGSAYQNWLNTTYKTWKDADDAYQQYQQDSSDYADALSTYNQAKTTAQNQFNTDLQNWKDVGGDDTTDPITLPTDGEGNDIPIPVLQDYLDGVEYLNPGTAPVDPGAPGPEPFYTSDGTQSGTPKSKGTDLYFRVNDGISVSDNAATNPTVYIFGNPNNFAYDFFEFYSVF